MKIGYTIPVLLFLTSCGNVNTIDLDKDPLKGLLEGKEWNYTKGAGQTNFSTYAIEGLLVNFDINDPCSIRATTADYIELSFPGSPGTYTLSVTQNTNVIFHLQNGVRYTVGSGFIQIVKYSGNSMIGYLNAYLDDDNSVEGSFLMTICN